MVAYIFDNILKNVGHFIILELHQFKLEDIPTFMFLLLITELCKQVRIDKYFGDNQVKPKSQIFTLKKCGEGTIRKIKMRKIDSGKSIQFETCSCKSQTTGPSDILTNKVRIVRDLASRHPIVPGETSKEPTIYFARKNFDKFLEDLKRQKAHHLRLEKAYTNLDNSHSELSEFNTKMI